MGLYCFFTDPTVVFTIGVVLIPIAFELDKPDLIQQYFLHPPFLACVALIAILELGAYFFSPQTQTRQFQKTSATKNGYKPKKGARSRVINALTNGEYMTSRWYLMNGCIYHLLMDPICGYLQNWSLMTKQYSYLDHRFSDPFKVGAEAATLTVWMEGALMCPGAILIFIGYRYMLPRIRATHGRSDKRKYASIVWVYCLEFVVLLCEAVGSYYFYGAETILLLTGQDTNMPYAKNIKSLDFNVWECFYFWFGTVFMVAVWVAVPFLLMLRAYRQIVELIADDGEQKKRK